MEGRGGYAGGDGVVGVGVDGAVAAEGEDDVRARADALDEVAGEVGEVGELELAVLVVEDFVVGDAEDVAGGGELGAAKLAELGGGGGGAAVGAGLPSVRQMRLVSMPRWAARARAPPKAKHSSSGCAVMQRSLRGTGDPPRMEQGIADAG